MKCPKCRLDQDSSNTECVRCGLIFAKYRKRSDSRVFHQVRIGKSGSGDSNQLIARISRYLLYIKPGINQLYFIGRVLVFAFLFIWGWKFILSSIESNYAIKSFMHLVNLPFHEAGHVVFSPFGKFVTSLGGSLGQIIMPLICLGVLLVRTRDTFGASVSLWWLGESFLDMAPYINDARALQLHLLGGNTGSSAPYGFHDWQYILDESGLLNHDHLIAKLSFSVGTIFMIMSFIWGGVLLLKQYRNLQKTA